MVIGIDLRALQTGHKYRGIGEVAKQVTNRILTLSTRSKDDTSFIFYEYDDDDPKELLTLPKDISYDVVKLGKMPENDMTISKKGKVKRHLKEMFGSPIIDSHRSDVYLQFDYAFGVPKDTQTVLVKHDLIPLVFWDKFFESAWVPFKNKAARTTLRTLFHNYRFMRILRRSLSNAGVIVAVSESTRRDLLKRLGVPERKTRVAHLGVNLEPAKTTGHQKATVTPTKPYLLFVGAGDARRRVDDLVAAYNNLKAAGRDIQLVLVGENFKQPEHIPNKITRDAVLGSSYKSDILTLGYVNDETKQALFRGAIAYVYPTKYEGFGIPILEAMLLECPVIAYKNSSIPEVGGEHVLYADRWEDIVRHTDNLLSQPPEVKQKKLDTARRHAEGFTWDKTAEIVYNELTNLKKG